MPNWRYQPAIAAKGTFDGTKRKIAVSFERDLFDKIGLAAKKNKRSFRAEVETLCESALGTRGE